MSCFISKIPDFDHRMSGKSLQNDIDLFAIITLQLSDKLYIGDFSLNGSNKAASEISLNYFCEGLE